MPNPNEVDPINAEISGKNYPIWLHFYRRHSLRGCVESLCWLALIVGMFWLCIAERATEKPDVETEYARRGRR